MFVRKNCNIFWCWKKSKTVAIYFAASETSSVSGASSATSAVKKVPDLPKDRAEKDAASGNGNDEIDEDTITDEDTMKNLKKTFAGIFGDIK